MLYKYCKTDGFDILLQSRLKATRIEKFNDPFELVFGVDKDNALENIRKELEEDTRLIKIWVDILGNQEIQFDKNSTKDIVEKVTLFQIKDFAKATKTVMEYWNNKIGLVCLSERPDIIQMWAHYTDNHRGIVVGIEKSEFDKDRKILVPVCYRDKMVLFPVTANPKNLNQHEKYFYDVINRKESNWEYEKEVRLYANLNEKEDYRTIPASSIKEIYLGLRSHETTEIVAKSIKQREEYKHLRIYKMDRHESAYKLVSREL